METDKVEFTEVAVKKYLDDCIKLWRKERDDNDSKVAVHYMDAYQSMRSSLFGATLPNPKHK